MPLSCTMGRHVPISRTVRNQGLRFGRCRHCRRDVIRLRGGWVTPPHGLRVVWRRADAGESRPEADSTPKDAGRIEAIMALIGAGLQLASWALAARWRAWRERPASGLRRQPILALASA